MPPLILIFVLEASLSFKPKGIKKAIGNVLLQRKLPPSAPDAVYEKHHHQKLKGLFAVAVIKSLLVIYSTALTHRLFGSKPPSFIRPC